MCLAIAILLLQAGTLSPRPDFAASRLRLSSAGSDVTIGTDASRPLQDSGATMVLTNFAEVGAHMLRWRPTFSYEALARDALYLAPKTALKVLQGRNPMNTIMTCSRHTTSNIVEYKNCIRRIVRAVVPRSRSPVSQKCLKRVTPIVQGVGMACPGRGGGRACVSALVIVRGCRPS